MRQEVRACWDHPYLRRRVKSEPEDPKYLIQTLPSQCLHMQISTHSEGSHSPLRTSAAGRDGAHCQITTKSPRGAELAGGALSFSVKWESTVRSPIAGRHLLQPRVQLASWARFWPLPTRKPPGDKAQLPIPNLSHWLETPSLQCVGRSGYLGSQDLLHAPHCHL